MRDTILGWNVGGTTSSCVVATGDGEVLAREEWASNAGCGPDSMIADFVNAAGRVHQSDARPRAVGVSIGGPLNASTGEILSPPHLPGWDRIPLRDRLQDALGVSTVVEHDAAACLQAEWLWGAAAGTTHAAYLTCGTGCGAGIMLDGRILRGPAGQTPEAGHIRLAPDGPESYGKRGSAESFCSGTGVSRLAPWLYPKEFAGPVDTRTLVESANAGDAVSRAVIDESARRTGQLCAVLTDLFAVQVVVLGSLARYFGASWLSIVRDGFVDEALGANAHDTRIVPAGLGERLQDLSAVAPVVFLDRSRRCSDC